MSRKVVTLGEIMLRLSTPDFKRFVQADSFDVTYGGSLAGQRGTKAGFKAKATINRFDYNLKWDRATETGGLVVAKEVVITVNAQLNEVK